MARVDVVMPQMGESIAEGTLSKWLKKVGDEVKRDEPIFEISTDKVDAEIPAPMAGVLAEIIVTEGQTVPVQAIVARLETDKAAFAAGGASAPAPAAAAAAPKASAGAGAPPAVESKAAAAPASHPSPAPATAVARGGNGNSFEDRVRTKSSPLVRKIAAEHGIELAGISGSGIAGRVTKKDIEGHLATGARPAAAAPARTSTYAPAGVESHGPMPEPWAGDVVENMSKIRALTADHMTIARRNAAHVTSFFEIDLTRVARIRAKRRADFEKETGQKLTFLPFIIAATVQTLKKHPVLNASVADRSIIYRKRYNIGIAVALDWGLIVPVLKNADDLSIAGITKQVNDLAARAREEAAAR